MTCQRHPSQLRNKDHSAISLKIDPENVERGPGVWKMNRLVLESELFDNAFKTMCHSWREKVDYFSDMHTWWDIGKQKIKDIAIWAGKKTKQK
jgi:hypothetical protein